MTTRRKRRSFSKEVKDQIVKLHNSGKARNGVIKEYELTPSTFDKWVRQNMNSESFEEKDNRNPEQKKLIKLRKLNWKWKVIFEPKGIKVSTH